MKKFKTIFAISVIAFILSLSLNSFAEDKKGGYILIKPSAFIPTNDLDHKGFDTSFSGEVVVGSYYSRNVALEAGIGYFQTETSTSGTGFTEEDDMWVIPVTINFKGVIPFRGGEINAGAGPGVYFANLKAKGSNVFTGTFSNDAHAVAFGGHVLAGGNIDITRNVFIGVEGKYIFTTGADLLGSKIKLNGFIASGVLGYRL